MIETQIALLLVALYVGAVAWFCVIVPLWPWDWKGRRKVVKFKTRHKDWR